MAISILPPSLMSLMNMSEYVPGIYENVNPETGDTLYVGEGPLVFGIRPENTDEARIWGYEFTMAGEGDITPWLNLRGSVGYAYTYPGNLEQDTTLRNIGTFFKKAFQKITSEESMPLPMTPTPQVFFSIDRDTLSETRWKLNSATSSPWVLRQTTPVSQKRFQSYLSQRLIS